MELAQTINSFYLQSVEINKLATRGKIARLVGAFRRFFGYPVSKKFFYRQQTHFDDYRRTNIVGRSLKYIGFIYSETRAGGETLINFYESFFESLRRASRKQRPERKKDFWETEKEIGFLLSEMRTAFVKEKPASEMLALALELRERAREIVQIFAN